MTGTVTDRPRILCLDVEGGHGGSSRSLFAMLAAMDRADLAVEVWCRRAGSIEERYASLDIATEAAPTMPRVSALPRPSRNLAVHALFTRDWAAAAGFRRRLLARVDAGVDLVHLNHEGLWWLARWLRRKRPGLAITAHVRTNLWPGPFARFQTRTLARAADHLVFITENERATFERHLGMPARGTEILNVVDPVEPAAVTPHPGVPSDGRLRVAALSSYSWLRGLDRLVDVAAELARRGARERVLFVMAGDMPLTRSLPGELGRVGAVDGGLADYVAHHGLDDMFLFLGHVAEPERVLAACHLLAKPTREDNPWGRDILEAMAMARPVASVGTCARFVETGATGLLQSPFDAGDLAAFLLELDRDRARITVMGETARARVLALCDGPARAADLKRVWLETMGARRRG